MTRIGAVLLALYLSPLCLLGEVHASVTVAPVASSTVLDGDSPHLLIAGLKPGELATVHAFRKAMAYAPGSYTGSPMLAHAEAVFAADSTGRIVVDTAVPLSGTYSGADPLGLLWSGARLSLDGNATEPVTLGLHFGNVNDIVIRVEAASLENRWVEITIHLTDGADTVTVQEVSQTGLNGTFARPKLTSSSLPAIIVLHGSEGGSKEAAREAAIRFANLGYAAFALNYFAWSPAGLAGIPQVLVDVPVEELATARTWLKVQPGVDGEHVALWGVSKGAELALVGAAHYQWVDRVVACVPSSVIWEGFGRSPIPGEVYSSWSIDGKGLPYVPYDNFKDANDRKYSWAFVHARSLAKATPEQRAAARIPLENSSAKILLLAATNDVVWPSGAMADEIEKTFSGLQTQATIRSIIFPNASHYICGTGSEPRRVNLVHKPEGNDPAPEADARAAAFGWEATKAFLQR